MIETTTSASPDNDPQPHNRIKDAIHFLTSKKPAGYGRSSNAPYYSPIYARELKASIDKMRLDKNDIWWRYSVWCTSATGISEATLYNRVNQSLRFLLERLDEDGVYAQWREQINVKREPGIGVHIFYKPGFGNNAYVALSPEHIAPVETKAVWYRQMVKWVEDNDSSETFVKENLILSEQEQLEIRVLLLPLKGTLDFSIDNTSVRIIKFQ